MHTPHFKKKSGFTLIETLVAIFILVLSITGPMVFASNALQASYYSRDQITAFYMTQEAMELVKNIRDQQGLTSTEDDWLGILRPCVGGNNICSVGYVSTDLSPITVSPCSSVAACEVRKTVSNGITYFGHGVSADWEGTGYFRTVHIEEKQCNGSGTDCKEAEVTISIEWKSGRLTRDFTVTETIYDWIPL